MQIIGNFTAEMDIIKICQTSNYKQIDICWSNNKKCQILVADFSHLQIHLKTFKLKKKHTFFKQYLS